MLKTLSQFNPFYVKWVQPPNVQKHARYLSSRIISELNSTFGSANEVKIKIQMLVWAPAVFFGPFQLFRLPACIAAVRVSSNGYEAYSIDKRFKNQEHVLRALRLEITSISACIK